MIQLSASILFAVLGVLVVSELVVGGLVFIKLGIRDHDILGLVIAAPFLIGAVILILALTGQIGLVP